MVNSILELLNLNIDFLNIFLEAHTLNENKPLYNAIRKHGEEKFKYDIIESGKDYENGWKIREPYYIKKLKPDYNLTSGE